MIVSILIPAYITSDDMKRRLTTLVDKIRMQIIPDFTEVAEMIVVDDGSTVRILPDADVLYRQPNCGVATARNKCIDLARGEWLAFVDADDDVPDDFVERCVHFAYEGIGSPYDIYQFQARHGDGNIAFPRPCAWGKLIRKAWIGEDRFDDAQLIGEEDTLFLAKGARIADVASVNYYHCPDANPDSLMKRFWRGEVPRRKGENNDL